MGAAATAALTAAAALARPVAPGAGPEEKLMYSVLSNNQRQSVTLLSPNCRDLFSFVYMFATSTNNLNTTYEIATVPLHFKAIPLLNIIMYYCCLQCMQSHV